MSGPTRTAPDGAAPAWWDGVLLTLAGLYLFAGLALTPFGIGESVRLSLVRDAATLVTAPVQLLPGGATSATQEALRLTNGAFSRYVAAAGWYAAGGRAADLPPPATAERPAVQPPQHLLTAARAGPALLSAAALPAFFFLVRRVAGRGTAAVAVVILGLHPAVLLAQRQVGDAGLVLALGLITLAVAARVADRLARAVPVTLSGWTALAVSAGLLLAAGPDAPVYVVGAVIWVLGGVLAAGRWRHLRGEASGSFPGAALTFTALGALALWVALSPALWGWLPERLDSREQDRALLVEQGMLPAPPPARLPSALAGLDPAPFLENSLADSDRSVGLLAGASTGEISAYAASGRAGAPVGSAVLPVGLLLTVAAAAGAALLVGAARRGYAERASIPPLPAVDGASWHPAQDDRPAPGPIRPAIGGREAATVLAWTGGTIGWMVAFPSGAAGQGLPLVPVAALLAAVALTALLRRAAHLLRTVRLVRGGRRAASGGPDEPGDDGGGESDEWQPAARMRGATH